MFRFSVGPIPVSVHASFGLLLVVVYTWYNDLSEALLVGTGMFLGIVVHELGHAVTARRFGARDVKITLFALGGVTTYPPPAGLSASRRFLIAAAGSATAILAGLPLLLMLRSSIVLPLSLERVIVGFVIAAVLWGVINWIPIRPLDGGQMLTSALEIFWPRKGEMVAKVISTFVAGAVVVVLFVSDQLFLAVYVLFIAFAGLRSAPQPVDPVARSTADDKVDFPL